MVNSKSRLLSVPSIVAFVLGASLAGCKKDEAPPPLPAAPTAAPADTAPLQLAEIDAGLPPEEKKPTGTGKPKPSTNLANCCAALRQNAASAPPPNNQYMLQAAAICDSMVASGQGQATMLSAITRALQGAQVPAGCR